MSTLGSADAGLQRQSVVLRKIWTGIEDWMNCRPGLTFALLSLLYFFAVFMLSSTKLLWLDEMITLHIANLGSVAAIWRALAEGADPNPPITYIMVLCGRGLLGDHELVYRLPAALGYWIGLLSLYLYLKRILPPVWALAGTVLSMTMAAFDYSYESRSYGIFYGLTMLAFFCWTRAARFGQGSGVRYLWLIGMVIALAAGVSTNYFAVLAILPIAAGELALTMHRAKQTQDSLEKRLTGGTAIVRSINSPVWLGLAVAASPLLAYRPLIARSIALFAPHAWNKVSLDQACDSYTEMVEIVLYPILALFAIGILVHFLSRRVEPQYGTSRQSPLPRRLSAFIARVPCRIELPIHEAVGVFFLMLYPFLGYALASMRGGMLSPRFVIPVCFGFAIAGTLVAFRLFGNLRYAGVVFLCFVLAWFISRESVIGYWYRQQRQCFYNLLDRLPEAEQAAPQGAPIVIPDPLLALTFEHYAPPQVAARVVFPVDFPAIRYFRGDDSPEENLWAGRNSLYQMRIVPLALLQSSASDYLIIAGDGNWLLKDLTIHHFPTTHLNIDTRTTDIGGFTPLARGTPAFYTASGDRDVNRASALGMLSVPFRALDNLPDGVSFGPDGGHE